MPGLLFRRRARIPLQDSIDSVHKGQCRGWVMDPSGDAPVEVEIWIDGHLAGCTVADRHRSDLKNVSLLGGRVAFVREIPDAMRDGRYHRVAKPNAANAAWSAWSSRYARVT